MESLLNIEKSNILKNFTNDFIQIINDSDREENKFDFINERMSQLEPKYDEIGDINEQIKQTIPKLKKLCNPENMMECFMNVLYFIENK